MAAEQPINYKALSWTVGVHVLLIIIFLLWKYNTPLQAAPVPEMGMEVNLGTSADGFGTDQPMDMDDPAPSVAVNNHQSAASEDNTEREVERTDEADAPDVAPPVRPVTTTRVRPQQQPAQQPTRRPANTNQQANSRTTAPPQQQRPRFVYEGATGRGGNGAQANAPGGNEGNTFGNGDRGVPHGTPGASNYTGSPGTGTGGISFSLGGRNIVAYPPKEAEFREGGKVVVRITVNRDGVIVNKQIISSTNAELRPIALRKLQQVKFNRSEQAPAEQFGNITFIFKTRS